MSIGTLPVNISPTDQQAFDAAYQASFAPAVRQLFTLRNTNVSPQTIQSLAVLLSNEGYIIDVAIMVWGWDPYTTMLYRQAYGYTWVPALGQPNISIAPGLQEPAQTPYNPLPPFPAGSVVVSANIADYPPYVPPATPPVPSTRTVLGATFPGTTNQYYANFPESAKYKSGDTTEINGVTYIFSYPDIFADAKWIALS